MKGNSKKFLFRGSELSYNADEIYKAKIYRYTNINDIEWEFFLAHTNVPVRIILWEEGELLPVDFLFIPRQSYELLVGFHGAEGRAQADLPKFQFVRSFMNERSESLVFFSDSTLLLDDELSLGWMVGNKYSHFLLRVTSTLQTLIKNCCYIKTRLVGHSGGGFAAMAVGSQISNSQAISVNGQVAIGIHQPWTVKSLQKRLFPEESSHEAMIDKYPERMDLTKILENRVSNSNFVYFAHKKDPKSYTVLRHFQLLADYVEVSHDGGVARSGDEMVLCNWKVLGNSPHALPGTVIPFIQYASGEECKIDLGT